MVTRLVFSLIFLLPLWGAAQITITSADMPKSSVTVPMVTASSFGMFGYDNAGANETWDYADLNNLGTDQLDYLKPSSVGLINWIFFFGASVAWYPSDPQSFAIMSPDSLVDFYDNSSSDFTYMGFGASFNGFPIPVRYSNADVVFEFPLNYGDQFSDNSEFDFDIPQTFYFEEQRSRSTEVDGWGTLILPGGSFDVLHVKVELSLNDSIYLDSTATGINVPPSDKVIYQWWGKGYYAPLLEVTTSSFFGFSFVNSVRYYDGPVIIGRDEGLETKLAVYPNPALDQLFIESDLRPFAAVLSDLNGKQLKDFTLSGSQKEAISLAGIPAGMYVLKISGEKGEVVRKVVVE